MIRNLLGNQSHRWANVHPLLRFLIVGILLAVIGLVTAKPAYRSFRQWRMDRNLTAAQMAVGDAARMQEARDLSLTVLRSGDPNIKALRILEKAMDSLGDPRHPMIARALISHPQGTDEDRLTGFRSLVMDMPLGVVFQAWTHLPAECRVQRAFVTAFARRLLEEKHHDAAIEVLLGIPADSRDAAIAQTYTRALIRRGQYTDFNEVQYWIAMELTEDGADVPGWLGVLEEMPVVSLQQEILGSLRARLPQWTDLDLARTGLLKARMDYAWRGEDRANILNDAVATWRDKAPHQLARFLTDLGNDKLLLDTFSGGPAHSDPELLRLLLDAAQRSGDWERMTALLDSSGEVLTEPLRLSYRALMAAESAARSAAWRAAIAEARADASGHALVTLHRMARDAGLDELAGLAMVEAIRCRGGPLPFYQDLQPLFHSLKQRGQQTTLLEIAAIYLSFEPSNPNLLTDYAYLACLLDTVEPSKLLPPLERMAAAFPKHFPVHITLAAVLLSDRQPAKAAEVLAPFHLENQQLPPAHRAVFLATELLNGRIPADDPGIRDFPWNSLSVAERRKFSAMLSADRLRGR